MSAPAGFVSEESYPTREGASAAAASYLGAALMQSLAISDYASLIVCGGSTPQVCFRELSNADLDWSRVQISLTDERLVEPTDEASNERMVRAELMQHLAAQAEFFALESTKIAALTKPFAIALVGMGEDGHFASIFPDMSNRLEALDLDSVEMLLEVRTAASPLRRVTMTLSALCQADEIVLLAFGETKRRVLDAPHEYPVGALLGQRKTPVRIIWAP